MRQVSSGERVPFEDEIVPPAQSFGCIRLGADMRVSRKAGAWVASTDRKWPFAFENAALWVALEPAIIPGLRRVS